MTPSDDQKKPPQPMDETIAMAPVVPPAALPDRYDMMAELGRGGMGIVYQVRDRETGEVVALKFLKSEIAADTQILERFKNELRLAHKITHRNVARLYEFHRWADSVYVSMEYVEGESLRALLRRSGKLDQTLGLEIARQLVAGLAEAHRQSIVHRDLKPENIMITSAGELKVMDFGISRSYAAGVTATGAIIGTPAYMAPEQAEGKPTDQRTDIYALGLILYEIFTGSAAFSGETPVSVALKQIRERPQPPSKLAPGLPRHIEQVILRCLEKDPDKRFQSVEDMLLALQGSTTTRELRSPPRVRSRRWMFAAAAGVVIATGAFALWYWRMHQSESVRFPIEEFTLSNGLPVTLSVDHSAPSFSFAVAYKAGVRAGRRGRTGLPIVMAHLMNRGSANVAAGEHAAAIHEAGGTESYGISPDSVHFMCTLPANQLDLALYLEADRMQSLDITQAGLEATRSYVLEQRANQENSPYGTALFRLSELLYTNFSNQQSTWGSTEDLHAITLDDAKNFYATYYTPANAKLILVGDFDPPRAKEHIRKYFEKISARPAPPAPDAGEPQSSHETRESLTAPTASVPVIILGWRVPALTHPDWFALKRLSEILPARLDNSIVKGAGIASGTEVHLSNWGGPNSFWLALLSVPGKDLKQLENQTLQEMDRLAREALSPAEMERFSTDALRSRAINLVSTSSRATTLEQLFAAGGSSEALNKWEDGERKLTAADLQRAARQYLNPAYRITMIIQPPAENAR